MGGSTTADSLITFGKLVEKIDNKPLQLPMRDTINIGHCDGSLLEMRGLVMIGDPIMLVYIHYLVKQQMKSQLSD